MSENNIFNAGEQSNTSGTNTKAKSSSCFGKVITAVIIGLICAGIGVITTNCTHTENKENDKSFESAITYLDNKINLSSYEHTKEDTNSSYWYNNPSIDYPAPTTPLTLEDNAKYIAGVTTVNDFLKAGYTLTDDSPLYIAGNASKPVTLRYTTTKVKKNLYIRAENNKNTEQKTAECLVSELYFYPGTGEISFNYLTLNNSSTLSDMIEALGKPNGARSYHAVTVRRMNNGKTLFSFCYHYKGNVMIIVDMDYFPGDNKTSMEKVTVSINKV